MSLAGVVLGLLQVKFHDANDPSLATIHSIVDKLESNVGLICAYGHAQAGWPEYFSDTTASRDDAGGSC